LYWLLAENYLMSGGEKEWLEGLNSRIPLPEKLKKIVPICLEFAVKPWVLKNGEKLVNNKIVDSIVNL